MSGSWEETRAPRGNPNRQEQKMPTRTFNLKLKKKVNALQTFFNLTVINGDEVIQYRPLTFIFQLYKNKGLPGLFMVGQQYNPGSASGDSFVAGKP